MQTSTFENFILSLLLQKFFSDISAKKIIEIINKKASFTLPDLVHDRVQYFLANGVVSACKIVGGILLPAIAQNRSTAYSDHRIPLALFTFENNQYKCTLFRERYYNNAYLYGKSFFL